MLHPEDEQATAECLVSVASSCRESGKKTAKTVTLAGGQKLVVAVRPCSAVEKRATGGAYRILLRLERTARAKALPVLHGVHDAAGVLLAPLYGFRKPLFGAGSWVLEWFGEVENKGGLGFAWEVVRL